MRKSGLLLSVLLVTAACGGDGGTDPLVATTLIVSTAPTTIAVNATAQASAIVRDQNGNPLAGQNVEWTSSNPAVATVDATTGVIRGVAAGTATITGKVGTVTGSATITVLAPVQSCVGGPTVVSLGVAELRVLGAAETKGCVKVAATSGSSAYVVIAANANAIPDDLVTYGIKSDTGEVVPNTTLLASPYRTASSLAVPPVDPASALQTAFESRLRHTERRELDIPAAQRAYRGRFGDTRQSLSVRTTAIPAVGELQGFRVPATTNSCNSFTTITARARHISNRAIIFTDTAAPSGGFTDTELQEIANEFDNLIYPTDVDYFGTPLDLDANSRIIILYTPEVNRLTPAGNPGGFVGGFFFAGDLFPSSGEGSCAQSNVAELFYVLAPDPDGTINGNKRTTATVRQGTRGTIAHEFQHMINASERIRSPIAQSFETVWLDEALSHFAEDLNGRVLRSLSETGNYTFEQLFVNANDYDAFFFQNFARFQRYLQNPGPAAPTSSLADSSLAARGAAWALLHYTADHYAPGGDIKAFMRALAGGPAIGINNLLSRAGNVPFDTLIAGWMVANFADDAGIPGLPTKYTYEAFNMRSNVARLTASRTYPLPVTEITGTGFAMAGLQARSGSGNYFSFNQAPGGPARSIRFLNADMVTAASFSGAALYILRTQ